MTYSLFTCDLSGSRMLEIFLPSKSNGTPHIPSNKRIAITLDEIIYLIFKYKRHTLNGTFFKYNYNYIVYMYIDDIHMPS